MENKPELPAGWKWVKLGEVCEYSQYGLTVSEFSFEGGCPLIRITDIDDFGNINMENIKYVRCNNETLRKYELKEGDILFARTGSIGRTFLYTESPRKSIFASYLIRFVLKKEIADPYYLFYYTHSQIYFSFIDEKKHTVSQPNINAEEYKSLLLPLPPLPEQKRIATKLQEMMQKIDQARTACEKQLEAAKTLPSAYLREVFESPESQTWERKKLGEVLEVIESGGRPKGGVSEIKEGIPSIGAEHLNSFGSFNFTNIRFVPGEFYEGMNKGKIQKGDVLVVKDGATTGRVSFVGDNFSYNYAALNEHVFRLRGNNLLDQEFLFYFLSSPFGQEQVQHEFHGAAQGGINQQFVNGVLIPLTPLSEQRQIAIYLKEKLDQAEKLKSSIEKELETINALPQSILSKAFSRGL